MLVAHSLVDGSGHFSLDAFALLLTDKSIAAAAVNSLFFMVYVTAGCLAVGVPLAWLVARTDVPAKLLHPRRHRGRLHHSVLHQRDRLDLPGGAQFRHSQQAAGVVARSRGAAVQHLQLRRARLHRDRPSVSDRVLRGGGGARQYRRQPRAGRPHARRRPLAHHPTITLPLVAPAIISSATLCMLDALSSFGAPAAIGTMANFSVLSTAIYGLLDLSAAPRARGRGLAADRAVHARLPVGAAALPQAQQLRHRDRQGQRAAADGLGPWRYPALAIALTLVVRRVACCRSCALVVLSLLKAFGTELSAGEFRAAALPGRVRRQLHGASGGEEQPRSGAVGGDALRGPGDHDRLAGRAQPRWRGAASSAPS